MKGNCYYFTYLNSIGGIETFFYNLAKKYEERDITIYYKSGNIEQIKRLKKYVRVIKYEPGMKIQCKKMFFNFNLDIIDSVEAKEYILVIHGDYKDMMNRGQIGKPPIHPKITKVIGVSKIACKSYTELTKMPCELCYNPYTKEDTKKVLNLISATRLTKEKGGSRMQILADKLDEAKIPYIWLIFTDNERKIKNKNVIYMDTRLDISNYIANADVLVQLSDNEGFCYSVIEALSYGKPVIVTKCPVFKELGLNEKNSIQLDFDMNNIDIKEIYNKICNMKVEYKSPEDNWGKLLTKDKTTYKEERDMMYEVEATSVFEGLIDIETGEKRHKGDKWKCNTDRKDYLLSKGAITNIKEIKEELEVAEKIPEKLEKAVKKSARKKTVLQK